jgi:FAD/FMN-containing dehydrogenase
MLEEHLNQLGQKIRGTVITPSNGEYEAARKVYNGMIDRRPAAIARCVDVADVITAVNFARQEGITVAIRGGGHNDAGLGVCDQGRVIDLSPMKGVRIDPVNRTVRVGPGCTQGDVDHACHAFGPSKNIRVTRGKVELRSLQLAALDRIWCLGPSTLGAARFRQVSAT